MTTVIYTRLGLHALIHRAVAAGLDITTPGLYDHLTIQEFADAVSAAEQKATDPAYERVQGFLGFTYDVCRRCRYERTHCRCAVTR